jgi:hypothetical protein
MARIFVRLGVTNQQVVDPTGPTIWGEGLDQLDPTVTLTPVVKAALSARANRVILKGSNDQGQPLVGEFTLADNWVEVEVKHRRLVAQHFLVYEFGGWQPRDN